MNLNEEFNNNLNKLEQIKKMAESLYNEPMPFNQILFKLFALRDELEMLQESLIEWQEKLKRELYHPCSLPKYEEQKND